MRQRRPPCRLPHGRRNPIAAAAIVVAEISTPLSGRTSPVDRLSMPGTPAQHVSMKVNASDVLERCPAAARHALASTCNFPCTSPLPSDAPPTVPEHMFPPSNTPDRDADRRRGPRAWEAADRPAADRASTLAADLFTWPARTVRAVGPDAPDPDARASRAVGPDRTGAFPRWRSAVEKAMGLAWAFLTLEDPGDLVARPSRTPAPVPRSGAPARARHHGEHDDAQAQPHPHRQPLRAASGRPRRPGAIMPRPDICLTPIARPRAGDAPAGAPAPRPKRIPGWRHIG